MSTLMFDENVVPIAKHLASAKYNLNEKELSAYIAGFVEGWSSRKIDTEDRLELMREKLEVSRERAEHLWCGLVEALLHVEDNDQALSAIYRALSYAQNVQSSPRRV
jgi:hypothetical protein